MVESVVIPLILLIFLLSALSAYSFVRRFRRIQKMQARAAASQNPAIIYTIPTNAPPSGPQRPNTLFPSRPTSYYAHSTDLPPSYEDVTKDSPVIVILPMTEDAPPASNVTSQPTTVTSQGPPTIPITTTSTTTASA